MSAEHPDETQAAFMRRGIGWSAEQIRDLLVERDLLAAQVAALIWDIGTHSEAIDGYDGGLSEHGRCLVCSLVSGDDADLSTVARALLRELAELRERAERAESDMTNMAHRSGPVWYATAMRERDRAERAEKTLREMIEKDIACMCGCVEMARAYFAADVNFDPMATETGRAVAEEANAHDCCEFRVFDRSVCACGLMHHYCGKCGQQLDACEDAADAAHEKEER